MPAVTPPPEASEGAALTIVGATEHNLKDVDVAIPLGRLVVVTGVSGSGKSTLIADTLDPALRRRVLGSRVAVGRHKDLLGFGAVTQVISVDQSPIGRSPKSNPATYTGVFDEIRDVFAELPEARARGFRASRFSFNDPIGACSSCAGEGIQRVEMHFLADVEVTCDLCGGKRYNAETLTVKFHGQSIADVLQTRVSAALELFRAFPRIRDTLRILCDVGLGYMQLGQSSKALSGGEAQRVKLASELCRGRTSGIVYILDEPTVGLHFADVDKLLTVVRRLVSLGNTVIVIEHNLDVIAAADHVIDLGPEGGDDGGSIVVTGAPADVAAYAASHTGAYLAGKLAAISRRAVGMAPA
jgi:excinuclease ABC subunit A